MKFYLGTHKVTWLAETTAAAFMLNGREARKRRTFPRAVTSWVLDSGGFTQLSHFGGYTETPKEYAATVARIVDGIGTPDWISPQDWMCEPFVTAKTGLSVEEHQWRTVENYCELRSLEPSLPFIPILQGWDRADYERCWALYSEAGVDLAALPVVGLGSVCRRQDTGTAEAIVLALQPLRLHGFGVKVDGLRRYGYLLESADSAAWGVAARYASARCNGTWCNNHLHYALEWRERVLRSMDFQQYHLASHTQGVSSR